MTTGSRIRCNPFFIFPPHGFGVTVGVVVTGRKSSMGAGGGTVWNPFLSVKVKYVTWPGKISTKY
jgi:hypothetical protein